MRSSAFRWNLWLLVALVPSACKQASSASTGDAGASPLNGAQAAPARSVASARPVPSQNVPAARREPELRQAGDIAYIELLTGGAREEQRLPLIVAIHGLGDRPDRFVGFVDAFDVPARIVLPRGLTAHGDGFSWFWFGDRRDVARISTGVEVAAGRLAEAIAVIQRDRPTRGKAIVTGFSQGGMLSFALALLHPDRVAAAYPLAGVVPPPLIDKIPDARRFPPIIALHGEQDSVIRLADTRRSVAALQKRGLSVQLKTYPGVQHTPSFEMGFELFQLLRKACAEVTE